MKAILKTLFISLVGISLLASCGKRNSRDRLRAVRTDVDAKAKKEAAEKAAAEKAAAEKAAAGEKNPTDTKPDPKVTPAKPGTPTKPEIKAADSITKEEQTLRDAIIKAMGEEGTALLAKLTLGADLVPKINAIILKIADRKDASGANTDIGLSLYLKTDPIKKEYAIASRNNSGKTELLKSGVELKSSEDRTKLDEKTQAVLKYLDDVFTTIKVRQIDIEGKGSIMLLVLEHNSGKAIAYALKAVPSQASLELIQILGNEGSSRDQLKKISVYSKIYAPQIAKVQAAISPLLQARSIISKQLKSETALGESLKEEMAAFDSSAKAVLDQYYELDHLLMLSTAEGTLHSSVKASLENTTAGLKLALENINKIIPELEKKASSIPEAHKASFENIKNILAEVTRVTKIDGISEAQKAITGN